jgi:Mrp family chromosome partitioning ATPase
MPRILGIGEELIGHSHDVSNVKHRHPTPRGNVRRTVTASPELQDKTRPQIKGYTRPCRLAPWRDRPWIVSLNNDNGWRPLERVGHTRVSCQDDAVASTYVVVSGSPGAGKTTVSRPLAEQLGMSYLGQDDLMEAIFDVVGSAITPGHELSARLP